MTTVNKSPLYFPDWLYLLVILLINVAFLSLPTLQFQRFAWGAMGIFCLYVERGDLGNGYMLLNLLLLLGSGLLYQIGLEHGAHESLSLLAVTLFYLLSRKLSKRSLKVRWSKRKLAQALDELYAADAVHPQVTVDLGAWRHQAVAWVSLYGVVSSLIPLLVVWSVFDGVKHFGWGTRVVFAVLSLAGYVVFLYFYLGWRRELIQYSRLVENAGGEWLCMNQDGIQWQDVGTLFPKAIYDYGVVDDEDESVVLPTTIPSRPTEMQTAIAWKDLGTVKVYAGDMFQSGTLTFIAKSSNASGLNIGMSINDAESVYIAEDLKTLILRTKWRALRELK